MKAILSKHLLFLFILAGGFLALSAPVCFNAVHTLRQNQTLLTHTNIVLAELESLRSSLSTATVDQRNFIMSGREELATDYQQATADIHEHLRSISVLISDNPTQIAQIPILSAAIDDRLQLLDEAIAKYRSGGVAAAREWVRDIAARPPTTRTTSVISTMEDEENHLLAVRSSQSEASLKRLVIILSLLAILTAGLLATLFFGVRREMAVRLNTEAQIRQSETRLLLAMEASQLGIWERDLLSGAGAWSERFLEIYGLPPGARPTREQLTSQIHSEDRQRVLDAVIRSTDPARRGEFWLEYRIVGPDGVVRWIRGQGRTTFKGQTSERRAVKMVGTVVDITAEKNAQDDLRNAKDGAEAANREKDRFLAVLSHELRTPLTPVLAIVSSLESREDLSQNLKEDITTIRANVELEARLIDDLLDLTHVARGTVRLHPEAVDIHSLLGTVLSMFRQEIEAKNLEVAMHLPARRCHVWGDPTRLRQVAWNLLSNAIKFTPTGGKITLSTSDADESHLAIEVQDTGVGIEADVFPRLFNAFEQGEKTVTRKFGGLGLGLSIAKAIVDLHNGELSVGSPGRNQGTTFQILLPTVDEAKPAARLEVKPAAPKPQDSSASLRILLVEDNEDTRRLLGRLLRNFGHQVEAADTLASAIALASSQTFDMLISDIGLPDGTGWELMEQLGQHRPPRAIALSGFGMEEDIQKSRLAGFSEHLTKPIKLDELRQAIDRVAASTTA